MRQLGEAKRKGSKGERRKDERLREERFGVWEKREEEIWLREKRDEREKGKKNSIKNFFGKIFLLRVVGN